MTTAYTSLLGLALPVTGELSGTWGDTVNTAITSLLDTAVAGTTSITTDADITLTTTTGASNQARQAIILWNPASGTTTRYITAPAQSKLYTVINASGGTQSIVIRGAGPTTGVTIAKGESAQVAWNGSDFVKVGSSGGAVTFTNLTVTGNTILGNADTDTLEVYATSTFLAPVSFQGQVKLPSAGRSAAAALTVTNPAFLYGVASTYVDSASSGTIAAMAPFYGLARPTLSTSNVTTYTNAATLYIANSPAAGGSATITNPFALYVDSGANYFGGATTFNSTTQFNGVATHSANVLFSADNTYDIGASGATRPRNLYLGGLLASTTGKFGTGAASNSSTLMVNNPANTATGIQIFQDTIDSWVMGMSANSGALRWSASAVEQMFLTTSGLTVGRVVSGGMGQQTGLTVIGGTSVNTNTPGVLTLGSHGNSMTTGDQIGKIDFFSNDASGGASGVQASIRGVTATSIGDAAGLIFYTGTSSSLNTAGVINYLQQWGIGSSTTDGNFRLTLTGTAGDSNGLSIFETSTGSNARLRISQGVGGATYNATYSSGGNYHIFQIGNGTTAYINNDGVNVNAGSTAFLTGSLGARLWTPGLAIGSNTYSGLYGPSLTYLADKSGSTWVSNGGGTAAALGIDEGYFYFARSQGVGGPGTTLTWTTYLGCDNGGNFSFDSTGFTKVASGNTAARPTATAGRLRWNTTFPQLEVANGTTFNKIVTENLITSATGGTITTDGDYKVHTFTTSGTFTVSAISGTAPVEVEVLLVGGGGAGGFYLGGGGGSGAMLETVAKVTGASYTITVGGGGNASGASTGYSGNGSLSAIVGGLVNLYAYGGGAGGNGSGDAFGANGSANRDIGSGGGGGSPYGFTLSATTVHASFGGSAGFGGSGGAFGTLYSGSTFTGGGGGGGALGAGVAPNVGNNPVGAGGYGGNGRPSSITGSAITYGGGGGGGYGTYLANLTIGGGSGGGGSGVGSASSGANLQATAGSANLGGGGGGGQVNSGYAAGGNGGSGVVIIRYKFQ